jgi:hypothetical protein
MAKGLFMKEEEDGEEGVRSDFERVSGVVSQTLVKVEWRMGPLQLTGRPFEGLGSYILSLALSNATSHTILFFLTAGAN